MLIGAETCGKGSALSWEKCGRILVKPFSCACDITEASSVERNVLKDFLFVQIAFYRE